MQVPRLFLNDVLFVLYAAQFLGLSDLNRTHFQKILYFCAVLAPLKNINWGYDFTSANFGPFSRQIHNACEKIDKFGYVQPADSSVAKDLKYAPYNISERGISEVDKICKLKRERERLDWITDVMKVLDLYGPKLINKLVYGEPTFETMRKENRGGAIELSPEYNRSTPLLKRLSTSLKDDYKITLDTMISSMIFYFDYLYKDYELGK